MRKFLHGFFHFWDYRNPFDRTCTECKEHQIQYCSEYKDARHPTKGWWEKMN